MEKASVQQSDLAVYYYALSDKVAGNVGGAKHKLNSNKGPEVAESLPGRLSWFRDQELVYFCCYSPHTQALL